MNDVDREFILTLSFNRINEVAATHVRSLVPPSTKRTPFFDVASLHRRTIIMTKQVFKREWDLGLSWESQEDRDGKAPAMVSMIRGGMAEFLGMLLFLFNGGCLQV